jgi:hypothetical protein
MRLALASLLLLAVAVVVTPGGASAAGRPTYLPAHCVDQLVRPVKVTPCHQLRQEFEELRWSGWGGRRSTASGWLYTNTCVPDCPSGAGELVRVRVVADRLRHCRNNTRQYTRLTWWPSADASARPRRLAFPSV